MTKLLILDKDGTLVMPKSGEKFVQYPEDQELLPGVAEAVARYVADGWTMAIASNQGGCAVRECRAADFPVGAYRLRPEYADTANCKDKIFGVKVHSARAQLFTDPDLENYFSVHPDKIISYQHKRIEDAIAEINYCLNLFGGAIEYGFFCPDFEGLTCFQLAWTGESEPNIWNVVHDHVYCQRLAGEFRKPNPGMIHAAETLVGDDDGNDRVLFVGDRPEDEGAAQNAIIPFMWAHDWRTGRATPKSWGYRIDQIPGKSGISKGDDYESKELAEAAAEERIDSWD